jgi:hypothetical protein
MFDVCGRVALSGRNFVPEKYPNDQEHVLPFSRRLRAIPSTVPDRSVKGADLGPGAWRSARPLDAVWWSTTRGGRRWLPA